MKTSLSLCFGTLPLLLTTALGQTIAEINGNRFISPYRNRDVANVTGLVTAKGLDGFWIRSTKPDRDVRTSESIYVFDNGTSSGNLTVGDIISLSARVTEYRASSNQIFLTELTRPSSVRRISSGNEVKPVIIGRDTKDPPNKQYTSLDRSDVFGLPANASQISTANLVLDPEKYGLDFWESLMGELVTVRKPVAVNRPNQFGDTWVVGDWQKTGQNDRGGLTLTPGDGNPEAIMIGDPLDGTNNPTGTKLGDKLEEITGVVFQAFGTYRILPITAYAITSSQQPATPEPFKYESDGTCEKLTVGDYNIENFSPSSDNVEGRADHIVNYLNTPDLVFLQEIQDDTGPNNNGVVSANASLDLLADAISAISKVDYDYVDIDPVNNEDGGQPGGNIRVAYLYNPAVLQLVNPNPGTPTDETEVLAGPSLSFNPGRVAPNDSAWDDSRKPLAAHWRVIKDGSTFFTVNVHFTSKGGGSPIEGDFRPPINGGVQQRITQANLTASFIANILAEDKNAAVILAGDCNEFTFVEPMKLFMQESGMVALDEAADVVEEERYTYLFDMNSQELDHFFVSRKIANRGPKLEHIHVNTWANFDDQVSDHDPSVTRLNVCAQMEDLNAVSQMNEA